VRQRRGQGEGELSGAIHRACRRKPESAAELLHVGPPDVRDAIGSSELHREAHLAQVEALERQHAREIVERREANVPTRRVQERVVLRVRVGPCDQPAQEQGVAKALDVFARTARVGAKKLRDVRGRRPAVILVLARR
jgi:hypothetical protein